MSDPTDRPLCPNCDATTDTRLTYTEGKGYRIAVFCTMNCGWDRLVETLTRSAK